MVIWVRSNLVPLPGSFDRLIDLILFSVGFFFKPLSDTKFVLVFSGTWPAVPEATRKLNFYSQQILQVWNVRSSSTDNNKSTSIDSRQPPLTSTPISSTDTRFPPSTEDTLPSTDIFHPTSIDTSVRIPIDTEPRAWLRPWYLYVMRRVTCMTRKVICVM